MRWLSLAIALLFLATASVLGLQYWRWNQLRGDEAAMLAFGRSLGATVEPVVRDRGRETHAPAEPPAGMIVLSESDVGAISRPPIHVGDVIKTIEGCPVRSRHELATALAHADRHHPVTLLVWRHGTEFLARLPWP